MARSAGSSSVTAGVGVTTTASTSRRSSSPRSPPSERQLTALAPGFGSVRRSASAAPRLSSSAATAAISPGPGRTARADRRQRAHHVPGALEHTARIVVGERFQRLVEQAPAACRDAFVGLGRRLPVRRLEQEEMAVLVDVPAAKAEMPVDDADRPLHVELLQPGFLPRLAQRRLGRRFAVLEVALREAPVVVGVTDQQESRDALGGPAEDDPAGAHLEIGTALAHQKTETLMYLRGWAWKSAI